MPVVVQLRRLNLKNRQASKVFLQIPLSKIAATDLVRVELVVTAPDILVAY